MRPILRGACPISGDFDDYQKAQAPLISRLGPYCSYCERRIPTQLAVEHIQPKGLPAYAHLIGRWNNYLLGCVNYNSTKKDKNVVLADCFLPDRDNTYAAFDYFEDGRVEPAATLAAPQRAIAQHTLALTGLDKTDKSATDENGKLVALNRISQRMETWLLAKHWRGKLGNQPSPLLMDAVVEIAAQTGFFSIWLTAFQGDAAMWQRLIKAFPGTATDCFDITTTSPVSPRPSTHGLQDGSKI